MSLQRMPNGQYVDIAPGTPPEVVARIRAQYAAPARTAARAATPTAPVTAREARIRAAMERNQTGRRSGIPAIDNTVGRVTRAIDTATDNAVHGITFGFDDVVEGGISAASAALQGRDAGDAYSETREARRRSRGENNEAAPVSAGVGTITGLVGAPVKSVLGLGARAITSVVPRAAPAIARATRATSGVIGTGAAHGATQAGLMSLADTNGDVGRAAQSAVGGGVSGAVGGAVVGHLAPGMARAFRDRRPDQAERVAYDKIASMLSRGRDDAGNTLTPGAARAEIVDATNRGTPTTLGDLTPEMTGLRGEFARRTELPSAGDVAAQAEQRLATAADRFDDQIRDRVRLTSGSGDDALKASARVEEGRKAQAAIDYAKGGAMDRPLAPTPQILNAMSNPTPDMAEALKLARRAFANDPGMGPFVTKVRQGRNIVEVPTTRAFDEIKKAFDDLIENGIKYAPDGRVIVSNASRAASKQIRALKDQVANSNPEYAALVGRQRDAFERLEALDVGKDFIKRMPKQPRELLAELKALDAKNVDDVRTGLIDALLAMRNTQNSAIKTLRSWERHPQQRAVLVHIMGGQRAFNEFSKFMRRELRAMQADALILRKSNSPVLNDFVEHGEANPISRGAMDVLRGQAYGGVAGGFSAGVRAVDRLRSGMGPEAQEQTLRLLASDGEGLESGVAAARAVREARKAAALRRARVAGQLAGGSIAGLNGTGE